MAADPDPKGAEFGPDHVLQAQIGLAIHFPEWPIILEAVLSTKMGNNQAFVSVELDDWLASMM